MFPDVKYDDIFHGLPVVETIGDAWHIASNVKYVSDGSQEIFKEPRDTYASMEGDCEDIAALMLAIIINSGLGDGYVSVIQSSGNTYHAVVEVGGRLYEAQVLGYIYPVNTRVIKRYTLLEYVKHRGIMVTTK
jgi:hypothetical protein